MIEDRDDLGLCTWFPLLVVFVFLLFLFVGIFGTPITKLEKEEYLKKNWPQKYEELKWKKLVNFKKI